MQRVFSYLNNTSCFGIRYDGYDKEGLIAFSDADFASDVDSRKSTSGVLIKLNGGAIVWSSKKQATVARSTTEAEFVAASLACSDIMWSRQFLFELGRENLEPTKLSIDNQSAIKLILNQQIHSKIKHLDIKLLFCRETCLRKEIELKYLDTGNQVADILTKSLPRDKFHYLKEKMGIKEISVIVAIASCALTASYGEEFKRKVNLKIESPCEDMKESQDLVNSDFWNVWESRIYSVRSKEMCEKNFNYNLNAAFNELETCRPHKYSRSIASLAFDVAKTLGRVAVSDFVRGNSRIGVFDDENILNSLEQVVHKGSRLLFENNEESRPERIRSIKSVSDAAEVHPRELIEVSASVPKAIWAESLTLNEIAAGTADLRAIAHHCRNGQVATVELGELLEDEDLKKLKPEDTELEDIRVYGNKQEVELIYRVLEPDQGFWNKYKFTILYSFGGLLLIITVYLLICIAYGLFLLHRDEPDFVETKRAAKSSRDEDEESV